MNENNLIAQMFNLDAVKQRIANCPHDEVVILCPQWPINKPSYPEDIYPDPETEQWDMEELEEILGVTLLVSDYNDLVADPHGLYSID